VAAFSVAMIDRLELERCIREFAISLLDLFDASGARREIEAWEPGRILTTEQAGEIAGVSPEGARKRCEETEEEGAPIGRKHGSSWIVFTSLWLDDILKRKGRHARLQAESRVKKMFPTWARPPEIDE
jgi:hypothetical protein